MDKKYLALIVIFVIAFIGALIKMCITSDIRWESIIAGAICGAYGIKRMIDDHAMGLVLLGLCILLMITIIFGIRL